MEKHTPFVTVLMAVYNAGEYLRAAVESILAQSFKDWELIVIDDGSTDGCVARLQDVHDARVKRVRQEHSGKPAAMNRGLSMARGDFYAIQDADDISHTQRLRRQVECLQADPTLGGVYCGHELIINGRVLAPTLRPKSADECAQDVAAGRMPAHDPTGMYRLSLVGHIRYAEDLPVVEGIDYVLRVGEQFRLRVLGECLYQYRVHPDSVTNKDPIRRRQLLQEAIRRMRARRRQQPDFTLTSTPGDEPPDIDDDLVSHFAASVRDQVLIGDRQGALRTGLACSWIRPLNPSFWEPLLRALTPLH